MSSLNRFLVECPVAEKRDISGFKFTEVMAEQRRIIQEIIDDETWLAGERLHRPVNPKELEVQTHVGEVIMKYGDHIRLMAMKALEAKYRSSISASQPMKMMSKAV